MNQITKKPVPGQGSNNWSHHAMRFARLHQRVDRASVPTAHDISSALMATVVAVHSPELRERHVPCHRRPPELPTLPFSGSPSRTRRRMACPAVWLPAHLRSRLGYTHTPTGPPGPPGDSRVRRLARGARACAAARVPRAWIVQNEAIQATRQASKPRRFPSAPFARVSIPCRGRLFFEIRLE
jgi:hypothetical protein